MKVSSYSVALAAPAPTAWAIPSSGQGREPRGVRSTVPVPASALVLENSRVWTAFRHEISWFLSLQGITPNKYEWLHTWPSTDDQLALQVVGLISRQVLLVDLRHSLGLEVLLRVSLYWGHWWQPSSGHSCCHMLWLLSGATKQEALSFPGYSILKSKCCGGQSLQAASHCTHKHAIRASTISTQSPHVHEYKS